MDLGMKLDMAVAKDLGASMGVSVLPKRSSTTTMAMIVADATSLPMRYHLVSKRIGTSDRVAPTLLRTIETHSMVRTALTLSMTRTSIRPRLLMMLRLMTAAILATTGRVEGTTAISLSFERH